MLFPDIHLTVYNVEGKFNRRIIGNEFYRTPSEVIVNGENRGSSKFAELEFGYNNVTIKFGENINTCADMFRGLYGIEEITIIYKKNPCFLAYPFPKGLAHSEISIAYHKIL